MEWRQCSRWTDFEVSDEGHIRRVRGPKHAKIMQNRKQPVSSNGYVTLRLSQDGRIGTETLHVLVCEAFHGPLPSPAHVVAHFDGDRTNNRAKNLRWATSKENSMDSKRHGTMQVGEKNHRALLTAAQVKEIREIYSRVKIKRGQRPSPKVWIAQKFGVSVGCIKSVVQNENWREPS